MGVDSPPLTTKNHIRNVSPSKLPCEMITTFFDMYGIN